jgi:glycosyltransferase involved in cell wall biosynthesis
VGHGIEVWRITKPGLRKALISADQLLAVSDFSRVRMADSLGIRPEKIGLLPNTFDADRFQPGPRPVELLQRYGLKGTEPVILTVARLAQTEQYKGYDNVLLGLPEVLRRFPEARYVLVGDGPDRDRVIALARRLGVSDRLIMAGYVPNEELVDHYNLCDVFAMPSKGEGFGIVFLEALACGKAVIAGNKDASSEALLGGELGQLVDPDNPDAIAAAICSALSKTTSTALLGPGELRRRIVEAFGYEKFRVRLSEVMPGLGRNG